MGELISTFDGSLSRCYVLYVIKNEVTVAM